MALVPALAVFLTVVIVLTVFFGRAGWFASTPFGPTGAPGKPVSLPRTLTGALAALAYLYTLPPGVRGAYAPNPGSPLDPGNRGSVLRVVGLVFGLAATYRTEGGHRSDRGRSPLHQDSRRFSPGPQPADHDWIYYATTTNTQSLLAGALLAQLWYPGLSAACTGLVRSNWPPWGASSPCCT